jgi:nucleoside-diphosphate-sugar epimerase
MEVGITGGTGFIGRATADALVNRFGRVRILTRRDLANDKGRQFYRGDLAEPDERELDTFVDGLDAIVHCAGVIRDKATMHRVHVDGTRALLSAARRKNTPLKWVQVSSVGAYGDRRSGVIVDSDPERPAGAYEVTKTTSDHLVLEAARSGLLVATVLRPSIVISPNMPNASFRHLAEAIRRRRYVHVGGGSSVLNLVDVHEVVAALVESLDERASGGSTFIVSQHCTVRQFEQWVLDETKPRRPPPSIPRVVAGAVARLPASPLSPSRVAALTSTAIYDSTRIQVELGHKPYPPIEQAVRRAFGVSASQPQ